MKDFKRFSIELLIIALLFFVGDFVLGTILDKTCVFRDLPSSFRNIKNAEYDIIIMGGSRAQSSYDVAMLEDSLCVSIFDYGLSGQNLYTDYGLLNYYLKNAKKKPKVVIWDIWSTSFEKSSKYGIQPIKKLNSAYYENDTIWSLINLQGKQEQILMNGLHLYKHNSNIPYYVLYSVANQNDANNGYVPLGNKWAEPLAPLTSDRGNFDSQKITYFKRFVNLCKKENIKLIFSISPSYYIIENTNKDGDDWAKFACEYVSQHGFYSINYEQDSTFLQHPEWFYNTLHVNKEGAIEFTTRILPYLKSIINE